MLRNGKVSYRKVRAWFSTVMLRNRDPGKPAKALGLVASQPGS